MEENREPVIQLEDVRKSFDEQTVHCGVDLSIVRGKTTVIVGPSGVGKSVLLKFILGLLKPDSGKVLVHGEDVVNMNRAKLKKMRSHLGVLFQSVALFDSLTVYENVALPLKEKTNLSTVEIRDQVMEKIELIGLEKSVVNKYPSELSGGMQKRVGLARALQLDPDIVLFDEPTTGLDPETTLHIYRLFAETQNRLGYTALIVSHDIPKIFDIADYVAVLHEGKIMPCATPEKIIDSENLWLKTILFSEENGVIA